MTSQAKREKKSELEIEIKLLRFEWIERHFPETLERSRKKTMHPVFLVKKNTLHKNMHVMASWWKHWMI